MRASQLIGLALGWGDTWVVSSVLIAKVSLPLFAALVYALHCPEMSSAPFIAVWYLLGMLIPATLGALVGPALLRS